MAKLFAYSDVLLNLLVSRFGPGLGAPTVGPRTRAGARLLGLGVCSLFLLCGDVKQSQLACCFDFVNTSGARRTAAGPSSIDFLVFNLC